MNGIVVFSTKGDVIFTSTGDLVVNKKKRPKITDRNIINQVFEKLRNYNKEGKKNIDKFLIDASRNIFPKYYKYNNGLLYKKFYRNKTDLFIDSNNLKKTYDLLVKFIDNYNSHQDKKDYIDNDTDDTDTDIDMDNDIDIEFNDNIENNELLSVYILSLKYKYNLSITEVIELESLLKMSFLSNFFNSDNIIIDKNFIKNINYLNFNNRKFEIESKTIPKLLKKDTKKTINNEMFTKKLTKFFNHINKN